MSAVLIMLDLGPVAKTAECRFSACPVGLKYGSIL